MKFMQQKILVSIIFKHSRIAIASAIFFSATVLSSCSNQTMHQFRKKETVENITVYFRQNEWYSPKTRIKPPTDIKLKQNPSRTPWRKKSQNIIITAKKFLGTPYKYGGNTPTGFDCSGFVQYVFKKNGKKLPRTTGDQFVATNKVNPSQAKPGDLLFFDINGRHGASHVGIYLGRMQFIHAPRTGKNVSIVSLNNRYWRKRFIGVHRVF